MRISVGAQRPLLGANFLQQAPLIWNRRGACSLPPWFASANRYAAHGIMMGFSTVEMNLRMQSRCL